MNDDAALNLMISEQRRKAREIAAVALEAAGTPGESNLDWDHLRPVLDTAIDELPQTDRAAVVLRFLEHRPFSAIGAVLRVSEDAARMRTDRALDKLRAALSRRGITSTSAAIGAIVAGQPAVSAPAGLAALLASKSLATVAVSATGGVLLFSSLMNTSTVVTAAVTALLAFGAGTYVGLSRHRDTPPPPAIETPAHSRAIASLRQDNFSLKAEVARLAADASRLSTANAQPTAQTTAQRAAAPVAAKQPVSFEESAKQKATLNNRRQIAAAREQFMLEHGRPPMSVDELVGEKKYIRRLIPRDGENYNGLSMLPNQPLVVVNASGATITFDPTQKAEMAASAAESDPAVQRLEELGRKALAAYRNANNGTQPQSLEALIPYFATPQEGADFAELLEAQKAAQKR